MYSFEILIPKFGNALTSPFRGQWVKMRDFGSYFFLLLKPFFLSQNMLPGFAYQELAHLAIDS